MYWLALLIGESVALGAGNCPGVVVDEQQPREIQAAILGAHGQAYAREGSLEEATTCLEAAYALDVADPIVLRDLAAVLVRRGELERAAQILDRAFQEGDFDPETWTLKAVLEARRGDKEAAIVAASQAGSWDATLLALSLGDDVAAERALELVDEETERGAQASLLLALHESARGDVPTAERLSLLAEGQARAAHALTWQHAARELSRALAEGEGPYGSLRLRSALEYSSNPSYAAQPGATRIPALRLALTAEGGGELELGRFTASGSVRLDHQIYLTDKQLLDDYGLLAYSVSGGIHYPLSRHPSAAVVGMVARFSDVFGDYFQKHFATSIEGGPNLSLRLGAGAQLDLGLYGVAVDFIDVSPPDAKISSLNRDRVGQRAVLGVSFAWSFLTGRADAAFLHDAALGDAFDAIGGEFSARLGVEPVTGILLGAAGGLTVRDFGPVGDEAIIGPAATRTELRTEIDLYARVEVGPDLFLVVDNAWVDSGARALHTYHENVLSMGLEVSW